MSVDGEHEVAIEAHVGQAGAAPAPIDTLIVIDMPSDSTPAIALQKFVGKQIQHGHLALDALYDKDVNDRHGIRSRKRTIKFKLAPNHRFQITWENEPVEVWRTVESQVVGCGSSGPRKFDTTHVSSARLSRAALKRLIVHCFERNEAQSTNKMVSLKLYNGSFWEARGMLPCRALSSLFLPKKDVQALFSHLENFITEKDQYHRFQIPYKKVILLEGIPGSGKTSLAFSVASHFRRDLYLLPLTSDTDDYALNNALSALNPGSVLVMEDIDSLFLTNDPLVRPKVTLSGITNVLDGLSRIDNLWIFLTSNHKDNLPEVLLRSGRVDYVMNFDYIREAEIRTMVNAFFAEHYAPEVYEPLASAMIDATRSTKVSASACVYFLFKFRHSSPTDIIEHIGELAVKKQLQTWQGVYI
jgi:hypothetical protein